MQLNVVGLRAIVRNKKTADARRNVHKFSRNRVIICTAIRQPAFTRDRDAMSHVFSDEKNTRFYTVLRRLILY